MTDLRDARLRKALDHAPDARMLPGDAARRAVRARAHEALRPVEAAPWWRTILPSAGKRMPWSAALATVAIASLITVLWHDKEVPPARTEPTVAATPAPAAAPAASAPVAPTARPRAAAPAIARDAPALRKSVAPPAPAPAPAAEAAGTAAVAPPPVERRQDAAAGALRDSASELAKAAPRVQAPAAAAPAPAAAPMPQPSRMATQFAPLRIDAITRLEISAGGRSATVELQKPSLLADLLQRMLREPRGAQPLESGVDMRVELREGSELAAVLELAGSQARWVVLLPLGSPGGTVRPDAELMQQLREELARVMR